MKIKFLALMFILIPFTAVAFPVNEHTISFDVKFNSRNQRDMLFWAGEIGNGFGPEKEIHISIDDFHNDRLTVWYHYGGSLIVDGTSQIEDNAWYHVEVIFENGNLRLYLNGILEGESSAVFTPPQEWNQNITLGTSGTGERSFDGMIEDFYITPDFFLIEDLNQDGVVDIIDIWICVNHILEIEISQGTDVNQDGVTDIKDVQTIANAL